MRACLDHAEMRRPGILYMKTIHEFVTSYSVTGPYHICKVLATVGECCYHLTLVLRPTIHSSVRKLPGLLQLH